MTTANAITGLTVIGRSDECPRIGHDRAPARPGARLVAVAGSFEELIDEATRAPADAWDFGWLEGRATEERPSWRYFDLVAERAGDARRLLDIDTGTGNMLAHLPRLAPLTVATDAYAPSIRTAAPRLRARGAHIVQTHDDHQGLPFADESFDLIISRHPVETRWMEIARVLEPGGHYFTQQVGAHSLRELSEFLMGPGSAGSRRDPQVARRAAEAAGLVVEDLRVERTPVVFHDVGAVVYFLRVVIWTVPDFTVARYRSRLQQLHHHIRRTGAFETESSRFLMDARRPE
jgi:SAM-dependent methyltransferase